MISKFQFKRKQYINYRCDESLPLHLYYILLWERKKKKGKQVTKSLYDRQSSSEVQQQIQYLTSQLFHKK